MKRAKEKKKWCFSVSPECAQCEEPRSLDELNRQRHLRETEGNIYQPLATDRAGGAQTAFMQQPEPEEPPPPYGSLFPEGENQMA